MSDIWMFVTKKNIYLNSFVKENISHTRRLQKYKFCSSSPHPSPPHPYTILSQVTERQVQFEQLNLRPSLVLVSGPKKIFSSTQISDFSIQFLNPRVQK